MKAILWRLIATLVTLMVSYLYTKEIVMALELTLTAAMVSTIAFYLHERAWNRVSWGKYQSSNYLK